MEDEIKRYVLKEEVSRTNIRRFGSLTPDDRMSILSLISRLKLGENRLREIFTLLEEISRRDQCRIKEIAERPEIQAILSQKELTPSQRTDRIKRVLMNLRYPRMHQLEGAFDKIRKDLNLPFNILLHHRPFFEGKGLRVEFQFETVEEYRSALDFLSALAERKEFEEMIES
jgi:hypothetical protein